jgi:hypothetical protein
VFDIAAVPEPPLWHCWLWALRGRLFGGAGGVFEPEDEMSVQVAGMLQAKPDVRRPLWAQYGLEARYATLVHELASKQVR